MTIKECIDIVDNIKPNQYTIMDKVMWLSFIDEIIINEVLKTHEGYDGRYDNFEGYSEDKLSVPLIVPSPYDRLYTAYLKMKIDGENGETARYNNSAALYNTYMLEFRKHYNKTHMPIDATSKRSVMPPKKATIGLSDAEYENLKKDMTYILTEYFSDSVSPDKLYAIVTGFVQNNIEMLKGKDGEVDNARVTAIEEQITGVGTGAEGSIRSVNSKALADDTTAFGNNSIAGAKGYYYSSIEFGNEIFNSGGISTGTFGPCIITLTKEQPDDINEAKTTDAFNVSWCIGDVITIINNSKYIRCATITDISDNVLTVDSLPFNSITNMAGNVDVDDYTIYCPDRALEGEVPIGRSAYAEGEGAVAIERAAHAEGRMTRAEGQYAHAEGRETVAYYTAHAEGRNTIAYGEYTHTEGHSTIAEGTWAHAEGYATKSTGAASHSEGYWSTAEGDYSHAEGQGCEASGQASHVEGDSNIVDGPYAHAEGSKNTIGERGWCGHAEGTNNIVSGSDGHAEGANNAVSGSNCHAEGTNNTVSGVSAHAEGYDNTVGGAYAHGEGYSNTVNGSTSHAEGFSNIINSGATNAHVEGDHNTVSSKSSHAEGTSHNITGQASHAEGNSHSVSGMYSHAEGSGNEVAALAGHVEGATNKVFGAYGHAEGYYNTLNEAATHSHVECHDNTVSGSSSHAEGQSNVASGQISHVEGFKNIASGKYQHVQGTMNVEDPNMAHIVGGGNATTGYRMNIHTLDWNGNAWFYGDVESNAIILKSSTPGSAVKFKITVDDSGNISAKAL